MWNIQVDLKYLDKIILILQVITKYVDNEYCMGGIHKKT